MLTMFSWYMTSALRSTLLSSQRLFVAMIVMNTAVKATSEISLALIVSNMVRFLLDRACHTLGHGMGDESPM